MSPDLAIITVPAAVVPDIVVDCAAKKVSNVVILSSGFDEQGDSQARASSAALRRTARQYSMIEPPRR